MHYLVFFLFALPCCLLFAQSPAQAPPALSVHPAVQVHHPAQVVQAALLFHLVVHLLHLYLVQHPHQVVQAQEVSYLCKYLFCIPGELTLILIQLFLL